jgi:hypothetical protein
VDKDCSFNFDPLTNMASQAILVSEWLISKKSSTLKLLCQMNRNLVGSIYGRFYASYQVSIYLAKRFQRRRFLEIDQLETSIAYGGHVC